MPIHSSRASDDEQRSPLKARPLRSPGQSCEERRSQLFEDKLEFPILAAVLTIGLAGLELWRVYSNQPPRPDVAGFLAVIALAFAFYRLRVYLPQIRNLKLAAEGEKAVGQFLERLRSEGYEVFHDIPAQSFNVDHVLVGPAGIFSVETKTWKKPRSGKAEIGFDGESLTKSGMQPDRDPIVQARAQATWLGRLIEEGTGWKLPVRPIVLFPGWWVEQTDGSRKEIWVLEPKALPAFLEREPARLNAEQIRLVAYHVSRYIRTFDAAKH